MSVTVKINVPINVTMTVPMTVMVKRVGWWTDRADGQGAVVRWWDRGHDRSDMQMSLACQNVCHSDNKCPNSCPNDCHGDKGWMADSQGRW